MNNEFALLSESKTEKERGLNYGRKIVYLRWHEPAITLILGNPFPSSLESLEQELHWKPASIFSVLLLVIRPAVFFFHSFNNFCSPQLSHLNNSQISQVLCTILETREWRRTDDILLGKLQAKKQKKKSDRAAFHVPLSQQHYSWIEVTDAQLGFQDACIYTHLSEGHAAATCDRQVLGTKCQCQGRNGGLWT